MDKVWAEAYALYRQPGFTYWFTAQDIAEKFGNNEDFQVVNEEYELLHEYYEVVQNEEKATALLTTTNILANVQYKSRD